MITATHILELLRQNRIPVNNEKVTQLKIEFLLNYCKGQPWQIDAFYERELKLDDKNIIDFFINGHIGLEVKIGGSAKEIYRQLERYAQFDQIKSLILVTSRTMGLPPTINGKPTYLLNLSKAWL